MKPAVSVPRGVWRGTASEGVRSVASEVPVAFVYDGGTEAVMMATPADLEDFALGFSLNDGVVAAKEDIDDLAVAEVENGIELRMKLKQRRRDALVTRRRRRAGPVGCGLCGVESIAEALPPLPRVGTSLIVEAKSIVEAMRALKSLQTLNAETQAVHAAAFFRPGGPVLLVREDVGRHNALDKLTGALVRGGHEPATGVILMTSRVSVELVQKAATMGAPVLAAVSAPTELALREAAKAGITVVGVVRDDGLEVFTHAERLIVDAP
jgi:FdhD protein